MTSFHFNGELAAAIGTNDVDVATSVEQRLEAYLENVAGDITGVTAGLGISGGGTSGAVTVAFAPSELSTATVATDDKIVIADTNDSDNPKTVTVSSVVALAPQGDITAVTAGLGISGGGSSGDVSVAFAPSELTAVTVAGDDKVVIADTSDSDNPKTVTASAIAALAGGGGTPAGSDHDVQFNDNGSFGGTSNFTYDGTKIIAASNLFATNRMQTGQSTFSVTPWSASTIMLGGMGSIGTQGSYRTSMAWNWERSSDNDFKHLNINSYAQAGSVEIGNTGILFEYDDDYATTHTTTPVTRARITSAGLTLGSGTTGPILSEGSSNVMRVESGDGYIDFGCMNSGGNHIYGENGTTFLGISSSAQYGFTSSAMYSYQYELTNRSIGTGSDPFYDVNYNGWIRCRSSSTGIYWQANAAGLQGTATGIQMYGTNKRFYLKSGAQTTPSLTFIGDSDTGLWHTTNVVRLSTGGVQRTLWSSSGTYLRTPTASSTYLSTLYRNYSTGYINIYSSSERYKTDIVDMPKSQWEKIYQLRPVRFNWDKDSDVWIPDEDDVEDHGLIAEEVNEIFPKIVTKTPIDEDEDGNMDGEQISGVNYEMLTPYLVAAVQDINSRLEVLEN